MSQQHVEEEAPIYGDILQAIFSSVPLIDLVGASHVSKSWRHGISSSLRSLNPAKPWLILHSQLTQPPYTASSHAYDPRSSVWMEISKPSIKYVSSLMSSHSNFLYMLSLSKLSFSFDPLNLEWHLIDAPSIWRVDPVVAKVGDFIVVAGGTCDFEEKPLAVEVFDMSTLAWRTCDSMPYRLHHSASSTWLSIASISNKLFVMEKSSGVMYSFDVKSSWWSQPLDFHPDHQGCFYSLIGNAGDRLIMVGLMGNVEKVEKVKLWETETETDTETESFGCKKVVEMPLELIEKLRCEMFGFSSIEICSEKGIVYIYNLMKMEPEVVVCELLNGGGGGCKWGSAKIPVVAGNNGRMRFAFSCADVKINELQKAMRMQNLKFKEMVFL